MAQKYSVPVDQNGAFLVLRIVTSQPFIATQFNVFAFVLARVVE
jgi:hypothetical protein